MGARLKTRSAKHTVRARLVVGADGRDSVVARLVNPAKEDSVPGFRAMYYHYIQDYPSPTGKPPDGPEFSFIGDEIAYVFPNDNGISCIALSVTLGYYEAFRADYETQFRQHITQHRGIGRRWITATRMGKMFSHAPRENYVRVPYGQGWALLGDAGQYQDPWSGFGMDSASTAACLLADAMLDWFSGKQSEADALREFHRRRNEICVPLFNETVEEGRGLSSNGA